MLAPSLLVSLRSPALFGSFCHCGGSPAETIAPSQLAVVFRAWPLCLSNPHELILEALRGSREPTLSYSLILNSNGPIYISSRDPRPPADTRRSTGEGRGENEILRLGPQTALLPLPNWTRRFGDPTTQP